MGLCAALTLLFAGLGVWQLERRLWKLDLIARVDARLAAPPVAPPARADWPRVTAARDAYRQLVVTGRWRQRADTRVDALTRRGAGVWLLTPLDTAGGTILVNRGLVPVGGAATLPPPVGPVRITGLLRLTESGGRILRANRPAEDRWYSRDVAAIAAARRLGPVAPFFIDAAAGPPGTVPIGGLTVVAFRNTHFVYAITWFALAALAAGGLWLVARDRR